jgi:hypothetical protein
MAKTIEIPNVPDDMHEALVSRAEEAGLSVADFVLRELSAVTMKPSAEALRARLRGRTRIDLGPSGAADLVREGRDERTQQIDAWFDERR